MRRANFLLILLGLALLLTYVAAYAQADLRKRTIEFEIAFWSAFILYLIAVLWCCGQPIDLAARRW